MPSPKLTHYHLNESPGRQQQLHDKSRVINTEGVTEVPNTLAATFWYRLGSIIVLLPIIASSAAQTSSPIANAQDKRGLGIKSGSEQSSPANDRGQREAKPELIMQTGYNNFFGATRLVFSPDGRLLATTTFRSSNVKLWDTTNGRELRNLSSGGQTAMSFAPAVAFSRDSQLIATTASENTVKIWNVMTGAEVRTLSGAQNSFLSATIGVYFIGFSEDGRRLVSASDAIRVWDVATGNILREIGGDPLNPGSLAGGEGGLALSPDGAQLARVVTENTRQQIKIWDLNTGRELPATMLPNHDIDSIELSFTRDKHLLAAGIVNKRLKVWDVAGKVSERELGPTTQEYSFLKFSRDGRWLMLCENYTVKVWEVTSGHELPPLRVPNLGLVSDGVSGVFAGFSDDNRKIATGGFGTDTVIWEAETGKQLLPLRGRSNMAYEVAFSADGSQLLSGGRTRWDLRTGRGLRVAAGQSEKQGNLFSVPSPDGRWLAQYTTNSDAVTLLDTTGGKQPQTLSPAAADSAVQRVAFSQDGRLLATTYYQRPGAQTVAAPDRDAMKQAMKNAGNDPGAAMQIYQQSINQQAGNISNQVKIWDTATGKQLPTLIVSTSPGEVRFSTDGRVLATLGAAGSITLWDTASGSRLRDLTATPQSSPGPMGLPSGFPSLPSPGAKGQRGQPVMPNIGDLNAMITNVLGTMSAGTMGRSVTSIAFSSDGQLIAAGGVESKSNFDTAAIMAGAKGQKGSKNKREQDQQDFMKNLKVEATGQIVLWDTASGREVGVLKGHGRGVSQVALSRDGRLLASAGTDNTIKIWDLSARRELRTLSGHTSSLNSLAFSPDGRLLASAADDGGTFLWDTVTGEHLLTLVSLDDGGEWLVVTPQGLFDGTPVSWNQILWRYNQDTFNVAPIEWFFTEYYYPGLLADVFAGKRPQVSQDVSKKDRRQPQMQLTLAGGQSVSVAGFASRTIKVRIEVSEEPADSDHSAGCGARDVRLFRNGSLVKVWHGDVLKGLPTATLEEEVTLVAGENRLLVYGFNKDNVKSKDVPLNLTGAESLQRSGTAYVIAVGVNEYANTQYNLKYAVADAQDFGSEVQRRQLQLGRFARVEVIPLLNQDATKANILSALRRLTGTEAPAAPSLKAGTAQTLGKLKRAEPEDAVIIYFAGHGTAQGQRFYLIPHDLGYGGNRRTLDESGLNTILQHSISDVELQQAVEDLDAGSLLLVIDACNSGQALESEEKRRGPMNSKGLAQLAYEKGMYILTAAQSFQAALEAAQLGHGLLTYALVEEGLKTSAADNEPKDGMVSAREWLDFATERVPQMQAEKMKDSRGISLDFAFNEDSDRTTSTEQRSVQRPRVFYRREDAHPLMIAKP